MARAAVFVVLTLMMAQVIFSLKNYDLTIKPGMKSSAKRQLVFYDSDQYDFPDTDLDKPNVHELVNTGENGPDFTYEESKRMAGDEDYQCNACYYKDMVNSKIPACFSTHHEIRCRPSSDGSHCVALWRKLHRLSCEKLRSRKQTTDILRL